MAKRTLRWVCIFLAAFLFAGVSQGAETRLEVKGRVVDKDTGEPIQGTLVEIENASGGSGYSRIHSDGKGEFSFKDLPTGVSFNLYGEKAGYTSYRRPYWYVEPDKETEFITLRLHREAILRCRITTSDGTTPVPRARLTLKPMEWRGDDFSVYEFERETGDSGMVTIDRIPSGPYELLVKGTGYIEERLINVAFQTGETREMSIALYRPASISGKVQLKEEKVPLAGIPIVSVGPSASTSTSNFNGVYSLRDLKPGTYGFTATKPGFLPYRAEASVTVREGEDLRDIDQWLRAEEEKVKIAIYQEVYPLKKEISFAVRAFRSEEFSLALYSIPIQGYLKNPETFQELLRTDTSLNSFQKIWEGVFGFKGYRPYTWFTREVKIDKSLAPGIYLARASTTGAEDRNFIFVSNLGVIVKRGKGSLLTYAVDFETNQPVKGVDIFLLRASPPKEVKEAKEKNLFTWLLGLFTNENILARGKTDGDGIVRIDLDNPGADILVAGIDKKRGIGISESFLSSTAASAGMKVYVYTDRPVYRPGDRVFFKGIIRMDDGSDLKIKPDCRFTLELKDSQGKVSGSLKETTDTLGTLNGAFDLSHQAPHGRYTLWVKGPTSRSAAHFFVQAYRKPDFRVDLTTDKPAYVSDETITCRIQASYFFGSPLADATVVYRVFQKMTHKPFYRYWWEGEYYRTEGYQSLIGSGEVRTDAQGFVSLPILPPPKSYDRQITLEAEVTAPSGRKVSGKKVVQYHQSLYQIEVSRLPSIHKMDGPLTFRVEIRDIRGKPVQTAFTALMEQEVWNPIRSRYEKSISPLFSRAFETDTAGTAWVEIPHPDLKPGYTLLVVSATDQRGEKVTRSAHLWLYDGQWGDFSYNYAGLEIWLDREDYREGDVARLLVNSPVEKGTILLTLEGQEVLEHRVIPMKTKTLVIEIPAKKGYAPNIFLSVLQNEGNRLYHKRVALNVAVEGKQMQIDTAFDRKEYRPGDVAELTLRASDVEGRPVKGDFSVGVVDEAVYYIRPDHTIPIHDFFYASRTPWVSTSYSFPIKYLGGAAKSLQGQILRKDFRDTAFWLPNVSTNEEGRATVSIPFPDNLTTWVTTIRGHSAENLFGEKRERALVTKPLIASLKLPRFFVQGDQTEIRAVIYNRTDSPLEEVEARLEVPSLITLLDPSSRISQIPRQGTGQPAWRVKINKGPGVAPIRVWARAGTYEDAEEHPVPLLHRGLLQTEWFNGMTRNHRARMDVPLSENCALPWTTLELEVTPHPALAGITSLDYLAHFPYGCVEQTLNSFVPLASYTEAMKGIGALPEGLDALERRIREGLQKLEEFQDEDGGVGWWRDGDRDLYLTSLLLLGVSMVKDADPERAGRILSNAAQYVRNRIPGVQVLDLLAFGLYALSEAGYSDRLLMQGLHSKIGQMDALTLSFTILALANHGMMEEASTAAEALPRKLLHNREGAYFPEPESYGNRLSVETTAFGLLALLRVLPDRPEIEPILDWLVSRKTGRYWISTRTTATVVLALSEYIRVKKNRVSFEDLDVSVHLNDKAPMTLRVKRDELLRGKGAVLLLPSEGLIQGKNTLQLRSEKDVHYALKLQTVLEGDSIPPGSSGCDIRMEKRPYAVTRVQDSQGNPRILSRLLEAEERLRVGKEIRVEVRFTPDRDYDYFILEDGLPSGFEVVDFEENPGTAWWSPYSHKERRDEKVVFFFDHLEKGEEVRVDYILRSELKGDFHLPPARLYGMYRPDISTHSGSGRLVVGEEQNAGALPLVTSERETDFHLLIGKSLSHSQERRCPLGPLKDLKGITYPFLCSA